MLTQRVARRGLCCQTCPTCSSVSCADIGWRERTTAWTHGRTCAQTSEPYAIKRNAHGRPPALKLRIMALRLAGPNSCTHAASKTRPQAFVLATCKNIAARSCLLTRPPEMMLRDSQCHANAFLSLPPLRRCAWGPVISGSAPRVKKYEARPSCC